MNRIRNLLLITSLFQQSYGAVYGACLSDRQEILDAEGSSISICGQVTLEAEDTVLSKLVFEGNRSSWSTLDCRGATIEGDRPGVDVIEIRSRYLGDSKSSKNWDRPIGITIRNCTLKGSVRVYGMGKNGEAEHVRISSYNADHVKTVRAAAPRFIRFENVTIIGSGRIPLYLSPGVTDTSFVNGRIDGKSDSVAVYLGAETARNEICNSRITTETRSRELVAVDASTENRIVDNYFSSLNNGGIYLYRNCGEGGTVRHTTPSFNQISNNIFFYRKYSGWNPGIYLGSRNGARSYCSDDSSGAFGSAVSNLDYASNNTITLNQFYRFSEGEIVRVGRSTDKDNIIRDNIEISEPIDRNLGCTTAQQNPATVLSSVINALLL